MSASSGITVEAWLAELAKFTKQNAEGWTTDEIAAKTKHSPAWVRRTVRSAITAGTMQYAGRRTIERIDGGAAAVPVYRVVKGSKR